MTDNFKNPAYSSVPIWLPEKTEPHEMDVHMPDGLVSVTGTAMAGFDGAIAFVEVKVGQILEGGSFTLPADIAEDLARELTHWAMKAREARAYIDGGAA